MEESSTTSCLRPSSYQPQRLILVERNRKHTIPPLNGVGSPSFVTTQAIGVGVVDEAFRLRIERDLTPQLPADGGGEAGHLPVTDDARVAQPCQGSRVGSGAQTLPETDRSGDEENEGSTPARRVRRSPLVRSKTGTQQVPWLIRSGSDIITPQSTLPTTGWIHL